MLSYKTVLLALLSLLLHWALPSAVKCPRHSHQAILTAVQTTLATNNPDGIVDAVFGLLGNAAAAGGLGKLTDANCLQQATADQAFSNAKAAGDVDGQVNALIYRALERNSGTVGGTTTPCTTLKAVNPEIAAIQQHQDPASTNAAAVNKAIVLELAKQIASVGGDPLDALKSGTFAPGKIGDNTGKGNTCDDANDAAGCIVSQNLWSQDEINAAVGGASSSSSSGAAAASASDAACASAATVTVTAGSDATQAASSTSEAASAATAVAVATSSSIGDFAASGNIQTFTGALGGLSAPPVTAGGKGFVVDGSEFLQQAAALGRSCDVQHNLCANAANSGGAFSAGDCDTQNNACHAAI
ncbi:hypothetical protein B0H14DRAFT_3093817 [Mycena olivaceomarginata]|nr:hypothetical protein B0H14DRAFT_3093817 [Mycena olivaceomarginata]